jgi:hypothetical protein
MPSIELSSFNLIFNLTMTYLSDKKFEITMNEFGRLIQERLNLT